MSSARRGALRFRNSCLVFSAKVFSRRRPKSNISAPRSSLARGHGIAIYHAFALLAKITGKG
jgi:hypothetical protein